MHHVDWRHDIIAHPILHICNRWACSFSISIEKCNLLMKWRRSVQLSFTTDTKPWQLLTRHPCVRYSHVLATETKFPSLSPIRSWTCSGSDWLLRMRERDRNSKGSSLLQTNRKKEEGENASMIETQTEITCLLQCYHLRHVSCVERSVMPRTTMIRLHQSDDVDHINLHPLISTQIRSFLLLTNF
jgi:hypothetical protein